MCDGKEISNWKDTYPMCKQVGRQIYSCWTKMSCVNRCGENRRSDFPCQCDSACPARGDCCGDIDLTCYISMLLILKTGA